MMIDRHNQEDIMSQVIKKGMWVIGKTYQERGMVMRVTRRGWALVRWEDRTKSLVNVAKLRSL